MITPPSRYSTVATFTVAISTELWCLRSLKKAPAARAAVVGSSGSTGTSTTETISPDSRAVRLTSRKKSVNGNWDELPPAVKELGAVEVDAHELVAPMSDVGNDKSVQMWPHRHGTDAMFFAVLRRGAGG